MIPHGITIFSELSFTETEPVTSPLPTTDINYSSIVTYEFKKYIQ